MGQFGGKSIACGHGGVVCVFNNTPIERDNTAGQRGRDLAQFGQHDNLALCVATEQAGMQACERLGAFGVFAARAGQLLHLAQHGGANFCAFGVRQHADRLAGQCIGQPEHRRPCKTGQDSKREGKPQPSRLRARAVQCAAHLFDGVDHQLVVDFELFGAVFVRGKQRGHLFGV